MHRNPIQAIAKAGSLVLAAVLLSACQSDSDNVLVNTFYTARWQQTVPPPKVTAETIVIKHQVAFDVGSSALRPAERDKLADFIRQIQQGETNSVELIAPGDAKSGSVEAAQLRVLAAELARYGFPPAMTGGSGASAGADNAVTIAVTQVVVIVPDCTPPTPPRGERPEIIMGCTNEANLAHMIANPRDLSIGRDIGPADGEALALGNERYRTGKIEPLKAEQTRNIQ